MLVTFTSDWLKLRSKIKRIKLSELKPFLILEILRKKLLLTVKDQWWRHFVSGPKLMMLTLQNILSIVCFEINYIASNVWMVGTGDNIWVDLVSNWIKSLAWSDSWQWWRSVWDYHHYHYLNFVKWKTKNPLKHFRLEAK